MRKFAIMTGASVAVVGLAIVAFDALITWGSIGCFFYCR